MEYMPAVFIGHGSPMNAIEKNRFTDNWRKLADEIPRPEAILSVSAHWYTKGTRITDEKQPKTIYDMYGFPKKLYEIEYKAPGAPELAHYTRGLISKEVSIDNSWGYDHGTWSVLHVMYPDADIPVYQMSVDRSADAGVHFEIGRQIRELRKKGVMILGSGNVVHNLSRINWEMESGYAWAQDFDEYIKDSILSRQYQNAVEYEKAGKSSELAFQIPDHFYPLLYVLGAASDGDRISVLNDDYVLGSLSMTCYIFS